MSPTAARKTRAGGLAAVVAAGLLAAACATPIGVRVVDSQAAYRALTASAVSSGELSDGSKRLLLREALLEPFEEDAPAAIARLHGRYIELYARRSPVQDLALFALAETSFLHAEASGDRTYFLAAAVYAYAFLFPDSDSPTWNFGGIYGPFDPRVRSAADLYNRALAEGLAAVPRAAQTDTAPSLSHDARDREVALTAGRRPLPMGELDLEVDPTGFRWAGYTLDRFVASANLEIRGLRNRYRQPGLGAPLAAGLRADGDQASVAAVDARVPPRLKISVSALVRLPGVRRALVEGRVPGVLSLYTSDVAATATIDGREIPLEFEPTAALAFTLEGSEIWDFELAGFLSGSSSGSSGPLRRTASATREALVPGPRAERTQDGLFLMAPYRPGRIPVVLVHGTASSPARWAELVNELQIDPRIGGRYQFWLFMYNTGNPIAYSAALLRESLLRAVEQLDPRGEDLALRRMVVIGHSQGGLLTKLTAVNSGNQFWEKISEAPLEDLQLKPETRDLLRRSLFVTAVPYVRRVIFVATPHRGSPLAAFGLVGWLTRFIQLPVAISSAAVDLLAQNKDRLVLRTFGRMPRSVDNMSPSNLFVKTLADMPIADGVVVNSIIAVKGDGPAADGSDGVVPYWSAHVDGAESEMVVRSSHSVQGNPHAIEEIRRILLEHAASDRASR